MAFPTSIVSFPYTAATGKAVPYDIFQKLIDELVAIETTLVTGAYRCKAFHSTTQAVATGTLAAILFDSEDFDLGSYHSTSVNTSRFTIPASMAGFYTITAKVVYAANATGIRVARIRKNGADISTQVTHAATAGAQQIVMVTDHLVLAVADYIEVFAYQDSAITLNTGDATNRFIKNELTIARTYA